MRLMNYILLAASAMTAMSCIAVSEDILETEASEAKKALATKTVGVAEGEHQQGCLLIYLDEQTTARIEDGQIDAVAEELFGHMEVISFEPALSHKPKNEELARELGLHRWFAVTFDESIPVRRFAETVALHPEVCNVQFNTLMHPTSDCKSIPFKPQTRLQSAGTALPIPFNDPMN